MVAVLAEQSAWWDRWVQMGTRALEAVGWRVITLSPWRRLVGVTKYVVLALGLLLLLALVVVVGMPWVIRSYQAKLGRHAVARALGLPVERVRPTGSPGSFKVMAPDGDDRVCGVGIDAEGRIWSVVFYLPYPDGFFLEKEGLKGAIDDVRREVRRYFHEEPEALTCECVPHTEEIATWSAEALRLDGFTRQWSSIWAS